jgi:hypothetical protein
MPGAKTKIRLYFANGAPYIEFKVGTGRKVGSHVVTSLRWIVINPRYESWPSSAHGKLGQILDEFSSGIAHYHGLASESWQSYK